MVSAFEARIYSSSKNSHVGFHAHGLVGAGDYRNLKSLSRNLAPAKSPVAGYARRSRAPEERYAAIVKLRPGQIHRPHIRAPQLLKMGRKTGAAIGDVVATCGCSNRPSTARFQSATRI